jgi:putative holliday junction resolvase
VGGYAAGYNLKMAPAGKHGPGDERVSADAHGTMLAVDYGRQRIGLALASMETHLIRPLNVLARKNRREDVRRLRELAREHRVQKIVVGLPLRMDGTRGAMAEEAERFAERLRKQIGVPVDMQDERLTSWEAGQILDENKTRHRDAEHAEKKRKGTEGRNAVDAVAAAVILRDYFARARG